MDISEKESTLLQLLANRKSFSINNIGNQIGLSQKTLRRKIINLREKGIIKSWKIVINPLVFSESRLFYLFRAIIMVMEQYHSVQNILKPSGFRANPGVVEY